MYIRLLRIPWKLLPQMGGCLQLQASYISEPERLLQVGVLIQHRSNQQPAQLASSPEELPLQRRLEPVRQESGPSKMPQFQLSKSGVVRSESQ